MIAIKKRAKFLDRVYSIDKNKIHRQREPRGERNAKQKYS